MTYYDAHFHAVQCAHTILQKEESFLPKGAIGCTCAHNKEEFLEQEALFKENPGRLVLAFGLHPQDPAPQADFLETLLSSFRISCIGEIGFDFFTEEFKSRRLKQKSAFETALLLAAQYNVPVVIHNRKALDEIFPFSKQLSRLRAVIFHSFAFGPKEALSLLNHGIPAFFSFGKPLLNGNKRSIACVKSLPQETLLFETDAPFQTLKGESYTSPHEICKVYQKACEIRGSALEDLGKVVEQNFLRAFFI